jgi:hypothetical protein
LKPGLRMETASVMACVAAMNGQMRKTYDAGVTSVEKYCANAALVVGPTRRVMTEVRVAAIGIFGSCMVDETRPK